MPYLHLDLPGTYPVAAKRELATRLCKLYADVMETQLWRTNVGFAELGRDNLFHLGSAGLEPVTMVLVEFRRGRPSEKRLTLGRAIVDACVELLGVPRRTVLVEFTPHTGEEMLRDGHWVADWTPAEAVAGRSAITPSPRQDDRHACKESRRIRQL
jgi:phenylpyruvate tautomerase PptA (4-oxalocrotonate tautomerase family)